ncbi:hypothetical protein IPG36_02365 [bacterium]|nr:MAG: hypothetical protein IPG36_02365 [bacterium]
MKVVVTFRAEPDFKAAIEAVAALTGTTASEFIRQAAQTAIDEFAKHTSPENLEMLIEKIRAANDKEFRERYRTLLQLLEYQSDH